MRRKVEYGVGAGLGLLAYVAALGCDSQVAVEYTGEPLFGLHGNVLLSKDRLDAYRRNEVVLAREAEPF